METVDTGTITELKYNMPKVIFVNRFFYPDQSATSQLLSDLVSNIKVDGCSGITVVTSRCLMGKSDIRLPKHELYNGCDIRRVYTSNFGKKYLFGRLIDFGWFYITSFLLLLIIIKKGDVVVVKTDPPLISIPVFFISKIKSARQINWLQDIYPEVASALGVKGLNGLIGKLLVKFRNIILNNSFCNVVLGNLMADFVKSQGVNDDRIKIVHNWSDASIIKPVDRCNNGLINEWGLNNKFVVCYSGNMGLAHEFDTIITTAKILQRHKDIVFLFIGDGAKKSWIEKQAKSENIKNIFFKPYQSFSDLSNSLSVGDIHLISLIPELEGYIVPSKLYGVMAAGRPTFFIGAKDGEIPKILINGKCGESFCIGESTKLADRIYELYKDPLLQEQMGRSARMEYINKYDKVVAIREWGRLISYSFLS